MCHDIESTNESNPRRAGPVALLAAPRRRADDFNAFPRKARRRRTLANLCEHRAVREVARSTAT
jgi:hypothetical protein